MSIADDVRPAGGACASPADALRLACSALDYVSAAAVEGAACGELLVALGELQAKLTAARAESLAFEVADWTRRLPPEMRAAAARPPRTSWFPENRPARACQPRNSERGPQSVAYRRTPDPPRRRAVARGGLPVHARGAAPVLGRLFTRLADEARLPAVVHCRAGRNTAEYGSTYSAQVA